MILGFWNQGNSYHGTNLSREKWVMVSIKMVAVNYVVYNINDAESIQKVMTEFFSLKQKHY